MFNLFKFKIKLNERQKFFLAYTVCFLITAFIIYFWYIMQHRTFIWREDGWQQHYKALIYYSKYLRSIIKELIFRHKLTIPNWDFSIGQGGDVLTTLHYYTIGDPFSIFSIFFEEENMYLYYNAAVILRMFAAGIAFSALCFETGKSNNYAVLAGSMAYAFCGWAVYYKQHPFFINPMIYLPLLIMGIEKIIKKKRPYLFIVSVALSAISNFYYFYMLVLVVIIYVVIRTVLLYRQNIKEAALLIVRIGASSILGTILSAVIFFPLCYAFLADARVSGSYNFHLFYPLSYYSMLPQLFISSGQKYYLCLAFSIPILPAVFLMFYKRKQYQLIKAFFITCVIITLIPALCQIFNGFTYAANRWVWAFALLCAYILTLLWPSLMELNAKEGIFLFRCSVVYLIICTLFEYSQNKKAFASIVICFILLFILTPFANKEISVSYKKKQLLTLIIVVVSIIINSRWGNSYFDNSDASVYLEVRQLELKNNETAAVSAVAATLNENEFYRYSGRALTKNANIIAGISSTEYYWSLSNPNDPEYRSKLNVLENRSFDPSNFDDRAGLTTLASVLYYVIPQNDSSPVPYGFTYVDNMENQSAYKVYRNEYALPLAFTYDKYMSEDAWNLLSPVEKEEAMLETAVLTEDAQFSHEMEPELSSYEIPYTITCNSNEITFQDNVFITTNENARATFSFNSKPDSEIFICFEGMDFKESSKYDLYYGDDKLDPLNLYNDAKWDFFDINSQLEIKQEKLYWSDFEHAKSALTISTPNNESKMLNYYTKNYDFYSGMHDFAAAFVSGEEGLTSIDISFQVRGVYTFDSIKIICQPMHNYVNQVEALRKNTLQNMNIGTDNVTGNITLEKPGLLCFSIPYSIGWRAYVDGNETKLYQANIMYMALDLDAGTHEIELVYRTPLKRTGIYVSLFGIVIFVMLIIVNEQKLRKNKAN